MKWMKRRSNESEDFMVNLLHTFFVVDDSFKFILLKMFSTRKIEKLSEKYVTSWGFKAHNAVLFPDRT